MPWRSAVLTLGTVGAVPPGLGGAAHHLVITATQDLRDLAVPCACLRVADLEEALAELAARGIEALPSDRAAPSRTAASLFFRKARSAGTEFWPILSSAATTAVLTSSLGSFVSLARSPSDSLATGPISPRAVAAS